MATTVGTRPPAPSPGRNSGFPTATPPPSRCRNPSHNAARDRISFTEPGGAVRGQERRRREGADRRGAAEKRTLLGILPKHARAKSRPEASVRASRLGHPWIGWLGGPGIGSGSSCREKSNRSATPGARRRWHRILRPGQWLRSFREKTPSDGTDLTALDAASSAGASAASGGAMLSAPFHKSRSG
jgi:hypothetical protein